MSDSETATGTLEALQERIKVRFNDQDLTYGDLRERSRPWRSSILRFLMDRLQEEGSSVERDGWVLRIDGTWTVGVRLLQAGRFHGTVRWEVRPWRRSVDLIVAARMETDGSVPLDYLLLPRTMAHTWPEWVTRRSAEAVRFYSYPSLALILELARISRQEAADVSA